uniref:Uncharacterized protein n=1 Tax=Anguilla anguilla TaxID=7936 RepID=A0A0E9PHJ0_ANGAN
MSVPGCVFSRRDYVTNPISIISNKQRAAQANKAVCISARMELEKAFREAER